MAYVVQYLKSGGGGTFASNTPTTDTLSSSESQRHHRNVYAYYCKDNRNVDQALNAFRVLLSQLLEDHEHLCLHFNSRVQEQKKGAGHRPTSDPSCLKDLLIDLVAKLQQPTFFIIDALDECIPSDRGVLLDFLEQICDQTTSTPTRALTSARASQSDLSEKLFPTKAMPICSWELTLPQRDRDIVKFLVNHHTRHVSVSKDVRRLLVENLTSGMHGCAMWARMTLEYIFTETRRTSVDSIQSYLGKNAPPKPLAELYLGVFENMTRDHDECKWLLARSLALIAGAVRPLVFEELLYALSVCTPPSEGGVSCAVKDLAELRENLCDEVDEGRIRQLLRPFADLEPRVGFMHQSLKETVLKLPALTDAAPSTVGGGIEGVMLKTCFDYLMLEDFNWTETIPDDKGVIGKISQAHQEMVDAHKKILDEANRKMP